MEDGLINKEFGRWTVIARGEDYIYPKSGKRSPRYNCKCVCGVVKLVHKSHLLNGSSTSCSCYNREVSTKHGKSKTRAYSSWSHMIRRSSGSSEKDAPYYYDKGIIVCDRWRDSESGFTNFLQDIGECPEGLELDRIDSNKGYYPENCRWVDEQVQSQNRGDYLNNTSGKKGVGLVKNYLKDGSENFYWRSFRDVNYKRQTKNFSINKLGNELAYKEAVFWREKIE